MRVDGILWYHTQARPSSQFYIHLPSQVFHNYGLTVALAGYIVDPDMGYASLFGVTRYKSPLELYMRYGVYAYPAIPTRQVLGEILMAGQGEAIVNVRGRVRLAYPTFTKNIALMPGSILETLVVSREPLPRRLSIRYGAKRAGTLLIELKPVKPEIVEYHEVSHPFNVRDVEEVKGYVVLLTHGAGDVGAFGVATKAYMYETWISKRRKRKVVAPALKGA
jgi:hypothetical protein